MPVYGVAQTFPANVARHPMHLTIKCSPLLLQALVFMCVQLLYTIGTMALASLLLLDYFLHTGLVLVILLWATWNGGWFSITSPQLAFSLILYAPVPPWSFQATNKSLFIHTHTTIRWRRFRLCLAFACFVPPLATSASSLCIALYFQTCIFPFCLTPFAVRDHCAGGQYYLEVFSERYSQELKKRIS